MSMKFAEDLCRVCSSHPLEMSDRVVHSDEIAFPLRFRYHVVVFDIKIGHHGLERIRLEIPGSPAFRWVTSIPPGMEMKDIGDGVWIQLVVDVRVLRFQRLAGQRDAHQKVREFSFFSHLDPAISYLDPAALIKWH